MQNSFVQGLKFKVSVFLFLISHFSFLIFSSCGQQAFAPKPHGYQRIDFPKKEYVHYENPCHYSMEIPIYSSIERNHYYTAEPCWYNLRFPQFNAILHLSYKPVINRDTLFKFFDDSRTMVYKHIIKADDIVENYLSNEKFHGIFYELNGNTATNAQFYITDSANHFLRGSLYFESRTNGDSIAPVLAFLKKDILHMLNTLEWK